MGYKTYPEYKDSGVQWLGEVPAHWKIRPLKRGYDVNLGKMLQPEQRLSTDVLKPYIRASNIQPNGIDVSDVKEMWFSPSETHALRLSFGDLLVSEGGDVGRSAIWRDELPEAYYQNSINRVRPNDNNSNYYLYYLLGSIKSSGAVDVICNRLSIAHLTTEKLNEIEVLFPTAEEQSAIAAFLDEKSTQIDQLIEKKTRFIELLKEKRTALITGAVTGKFDVRRGKPYAEYKDSGVEWLGKVPAHWEVKPLKRGYSVKLGKTLQPVQKAPQDVLKPYLRASNIQPDGISVSGVKEMWFSPLELGVLRLKYGDLLVSEGGDVGRSAIWRRELEEAYYQNSINRVRGLEGNNNYYLNYLLSCIKESGAIDVICNRLSIAHLTTEKLNEIQILFPTAKEQSAIAAFLDEKTTQIDQLIKKTQQSIDLLKEKRATLITAAVTGKIDVRNWNTEAA